MKLYGIKACDTCRKALKTLQAAGRDVTFVDVRDTPLSAEKLAEFHDALGDDMLNTRSTTWRGLTDADRARAPMDLLAEHPTLMKRPVIEADRLYLGWKKDVQDALL
ncbi:arsenate reductase family protein [uncultured Litoreibacter sp.]|uniref:arsenate reductase family protein n=1 Tax=uncultured Litoreibacter sp. TaxID=1392394 RepID=UPI00261386F5|nr:ArsC/Spx/MgsR family protein [uncultured Litoreibacter sp.]